MPELEVERISLLMDGSVSIVGLTCAVDDLQITYFVSRGDLFDPANWEVDLAGLAVAADLAGVDDLGRPAQVGHGPEHRVPRDAARPLRRLRDHDLRRLRRG